MKITLPVYNLGFLCLFLLIGCFPQEEKQPTLKAYDLNHPEKFFMPETLLEISGIAFATGKSDTIYAVQDEEGKVFKLAPGVKKQVHSRFGKNGDYEDITILGSEVIVLKSTGQLLSFPVASTSQTEITEVKQWAKLLPKGEYEGLYADDASGKVYALCKACDDDDPKKSVSVFQFGREDTQASRFTIDVKDIKDKAGKMKAGFKPSGLALNPVTHDWYIISSVNKLIVVTDSQWHIKEVAPLDGNAFNQPEGITFDALGNLYISNEGGDISEGNILKFSMLKNK